MIYLDASALVTMVVERRHANALRQFLAIHATERTSTSVVGMVETVRACDQVGTYPNLLAELIREHKEINVTDAVRDLAANLPGSLRALDALHVASAEQFGSELKALVTYDKRMAEVARQRGLRVEMPGME
jgi:predicted nucleic acid-binding protein